MKTRSFLRSILTFIWSFIRIKREIKVVENVAAVPFSIVSVDIKGKRNYVKVGSKITITFSERLNGESVSDFMYRFISIKSLSDCKLSFDGERVLTLYPSLQPGRSYDIYFVGIRSALGEPLPSSPISFRTAN